MDPVPWMFVLAPSTTGIEVWEADGKMVVLLHGQVPSDQCLRVQAWLDAAAPGRTCRVVAEVS